MWQPFQRVWIASSDPKSGEGPESVPVECPTSGWREVAGIRCGSDRSETKAPAAAKLRSHETNAAQASERHGSDAGRLRDARRVETHEGDLVCVELGEPDVAVGTVRDVMGPGRRCRHTPLLEVAGRRDSSDPVREP